MGVIKQQDPMGSQNRWLIDNGGSVYFLSTLIDILFSQMLQQYNLDILVFQSARVSYTAPSSNTTILEGAIQTSPSRASRPMSRATVAPPLFSPARTATARWPLTRKQPLSALRNPRAIHPHSRRGTLPHLVGVTRKTYRTPTLPVRATPWTLHPETPQTARSFQIKRTEIPPVTET